VGGVRESECSQVLLDFFATHRMAGTQAR
jgi:hypothetical protein